LVSTGRRIFGDSDENDFVQKSSKVKFLESF
jgi:hypothetical protein